MKEKFCPYCETNLKGVDKFHIYRCAPEDKSKNEIKFEYIGFNFPYISDKSNLLLEYEINLKSLPDLKKEFGIDFKSVIFLLEYHNIDKRTISKSNKLISSKKYKETCIKKYGVDNVSKLSNIKDKKKKTFMGNYGVDNIWKSKEFRDKLNQHMLEKYGVMSVPNINGNADSWGWKKLTTEEKEERISKLLFNFSSNLEMRVFNLLSDNGFNFKPQFWCGGKSFDFMLWDYNTVIEVNGDYWHANPIIYKEDDYVTKLGKRILAKDVWEYDKNKHEIILNNKINLVILWENEINSLTDSELLGLIIKNLNNGCK